MVKLDLKIPDRFLEEEVRCGFKVTNEIKQIWAIELDLLMKFDSICKKYKLKYVAAYGTLLGAVRHQGFIPWDDDLDVAMPRKDYEVLLSVASKEFGYPYYLESFHSDPSFIYDKAKLINVQTTAYENPFLVHHGLFLDIFPYDNIVEDPNLLKKQGQELKSLFKEFQRISTCNTKWYVHQEGISSLRKMVRFVEYYKLKVLKRRVGGKYHKKLFYEFENICKRYNSIQVKYMGAIAEYQTNVIDYMYASDFENLELADFEFIKIPIMRHYDETLTRLYGDYHQYVKGTSAHTFKILDTDRPYTEVLKEKGII